MGMDQPSLGNLPVPTPPRATPNPFPQIQPSGFTKRKKAFSILAVVLVAAGLTVLGYRYWQNQNLKPKWREAPVGLIADKVSQSAKLAINLPEGVKMQATEAKDHISFDPAIKGSWSSGDKTDRLMFDPDEKLVLGYYYKVTLTAGETRGAKDFQVDEDPKVIAIFPNNNTEATELSEITIAFNRPMVPLTTLDELEKDQVPVEIKPDTEGRFKWITTRTLKFLPEKRLVRSSHYEVKVEKGFVSMDGLAAETLESKFTTRPLRYEGESHHQGITLYDEPVTFRFNQPVDLEETQKFIEVTNLATNKSAAFEVEYGTRTVNLGEIGKNEEYTDKSVIRIFQARDNHGRVKFWDNKTNYRIKIKGSRPGEGDIKLDEPREITIQVPDVVEFVRAASPRSELVEPGLFDLQGTLIINFFEQIDKDRSDIEAPGLKDISYGEQCKTGEDGQEVRIGPECEKESNKKQIILSFKEGEFKPGQSFDVELKKVVNVNRLQINAESIKQNVKIYPELKLLRTMPGEGGKDASVTELVLCTNSPLKDAEPENFYDRFKSNISVGAWYWQEAFKVVPNQGGYAKCGAGEYENRINYGLRPQTGYELEIKLIDHFGQTNSSKLKFTSGKIDSTYRKFTSLQKRYNVTSPAQTKLTYAARNLEYMDLHLCKISGTIMLEYLNYDSQLDSVTPGGNLKCEQQFSKKISLPDKYWTLNYFQVNLKDITSDLLGYYVLSFSHPELREQVYNPKTYNYEPGSRLLQERTFLNVTNLAVQEKKVEVQDGVLVKERSLEGKILQKSQGNLYWVSQIGSLAPVGGANIQVFQKNQKKYTLSGTSITGADGVARATPYSGEGAAIVSFGTDSTIVSSQLDKFQWAYSEMGGDKIYIYTDRPIYRPGQEVYIKGIYRIGFDAEFEIYKDKPISLAVYNSKNEPILTKDLEVNQNGTVNTSLILPKEAPLGSYRIEAMGGYYSFDVEEYVPSAFKIDLNTDKEEYIAGEEFTLNVDANYYFGVPVESGEAGYSILAQDYYFDRFTDGRFQFGAPWYYSYNPYYGDSFVLRGKADINPQGKAQIKHKLDFNRFFQGDNQNKSKIFIIRTTVKNSTGQSVSSEKSFIVHRGEFYLGVNLEKAYFGKNEPNKIFIKSVDTQGREKSVNNIEGKIVKVKWEYFKRQEVDGGYYYHSERKLEIVREFKAETDGQGNVSLDLQLADEGEYEVSLKANDGKGNSIVATQDFYVYGQGTVQVRPLNNESLDLAVEKAQLDVGENGKIVIKSPFEKAKALIAIESGRILDYRIVDVDRSFHDYSFSVKENYAPNVYVTVLLLSPKPEVKFGQAQFFVNTKEKTISVEAVPNKNHYLPGEEVVLDVTTKDSNGKAVSAEVSLAVADLSVLALVGNPKKDPVSFFYNGRPLGVSTASNIKNILTEVEIPSGTKGGGGSEPGDLAKKKRGIFKDTAYWNAAVITDSNGKAQVKFTLPDNLTTWQIESLGLTPDTRLGVGYKEFTAKKQLMVTPLIPRFTIPGDEFTVGAKVFNQTGSTQDLEVSFSSPSLEIFGKKESKLKLKDGETDTVYFKVKAPEMQDTGEHKVVFSAKNEKFEDTVENSFPIKRNETYEAVATANYTTDLKAEEFVWLPKNVLSGRGGVKVQAAATLAGALPEAINYLAGYPYGCSEQLASKIAGVAVMKRLSNTKNLSDKFTPLENATGEVGGKIKFSGDDGGLMPPTSLTGFILPKIEFDGQSFTADDVVEIGLARILANQTPEGGFAYYPGMRPDYYLTLHILNTFGQIKQAGYKVDESAVNRAGKYVYQEFNNNVIYNASKDALVLTGFTLSTIPGVKAEYESLLPRILRLESDSKFINENISNLSLTYLAMLLSRQSASNAFAEKVFEILENRVVADGRGAYLGAGKNEMLWAYYETPIKDTALFIKAISLAKREFPFTGNLLRFIKNSRFKDNAWGSTNNTLSVMDALVDYLDWKRETESNFTLEILLDEKPKAEFTFNDKTILDSLDSFIPINEFSPEKLSRLSFAKKNLNNLANGFYYDVSLRYFLPVDEIAPRDEGFAIERSLYALEDKNGEKPVKEAKVGEVLRGHLKIVVTRPSNFVAVESFIPAGVELVNFKFATEDKSLLDQVNNPGYGYYNAPAYYNLPQLETKPTIVKEPGRLTKIGRAIKGVFTRKKASPGSQGVAELPDEAYSGQVQRASSLYADSEELHDDRLMLFNQQLSPGVYEYDYFVRALIPGKFQHLPAVASELYSPENFGRTEGGYFEVKE